MKVVTLLSGGLDSSLLAYLLKEEMHEQYPIFINYGQLNFKREWDACVNTCLQLGLRTSEMIDLKGYGESIPSGLTCENLDIVNDAFLPNRNALFLISASAYAFKNDCTHVAIGFLNEANHIFPDQTRGFLDKMEELLYISLGKRIYIMSPFISLNKIDIIKLAKEKGVTNTYSCHLGSEKPCGKCIACLEFINSKKI
ncbi:MAG: 7-cyano-7-deazaguanine synthase [Bacteroidaceae bacterium]|nr:7-cyano-7-deazaguanine synthase [Bacteroidaceae bacterium]MEA5099185.1 7-cyano-7-deazaguanine synthase [Bacteroidales bacterium]